MIERFVRGGAEVTVVDLSDRLRNETSPFEPMPHQIDYVGHRQTPELFADALGIPAETWPTGLMAAVERVSLSSHAGTHVDAPYHYAPDSEGKPARTIDQVPLEWCFGAGVCLDFSDRPAGDGIDADDVAKELGRIGHVLAPGDVVLVRTDASLEFDRPGYENRHAGLRASAVEYLVEAGVRMIGIDAWGLDRPFDVMAEEARAGDVEQLWEAHFYGRRREYCQIEKLCNLDELPAPTGFRVYAFPVNLAHASAGWARVVAVFEHPCPASARREEPTEER